MATRNRLDALVQAKPGDHTSIFGLDESGRPINAAGKVQQQASSWATMLPGHVGTCTTQSGVAVSKKRGLRGDAVEKKRLKTWQPH